MKILMLTDVFFPDTIGGAGRVVYHLSLELSNKGHEVHIITRKTNTRLSSHQKLGTNLFVHRFRLPKKKSPALFLWEIKNSYSMAKQLAGKITFDIVCIHQSLAAAGPMLSRCFRNIPFVYYYHSPWHEEFLIKKENNKGSAGKLYIALAYIMRCVEKRTLLKARKIIVLSRYMFNKVVNIHHVPEKKIVIIPGGADIDRFEVPAVDKPAAKYSARLPLDKTIFLTVRNLVPRMGIETLIEAFARSSILQQKALLLIGGKGHLKDRLEAMVARHRLQEAVKLLGHIKENHLPGIYQAADFFVLPTKKLEGFGLVILEALACGTPVLGTPVGAIPEVIGLLDERLIFEGTNRHAIKKKMEEVVGRPDRYTFTPETCHKFVEKNYTWKKVADLFEKEMILMGKNL